MFHEVKVVLCTISTLSNPSLGSKNIFNFVPVANLVVDEASQIGIVNYMVSLSTLFTYQNAQLDPQHILAMFKQLRKVCFFGDPKQREFPQEALHPDPEISHLHFKYHLSEKKQHPHFKAYTMFGI